MILIYRRIQPVEKSYWYRSITEYSERAKRTIYNLASLSA
jgi:hypothetical protein